MNGVYKWKCKKVFYNPKFISETVTVDTLAGPICGLSHVRMALARSVYKKIIFFIQFRTCPNNVNARFYHSQ